MKKILFLLVIFVCTFFLTSCFMFEYQVEYCDEYGFTIKTISVGYNEKIEEIDICPKEGYTFMGWYHNDRKWDFDNDKVKKNIRLVQKWSIDSFSIYFDTDGGDPISPLSYQYDKQLVLPKATKKDFLFAWWLMGDEKSETTIRMPSNDIYLKAVWLIESPGWKISNDVFKGYKSDAKEFSVPGIYALHMEKREIKIIDTIAFYNNINLERLFISEGIETIKIQAINNCPNLEMIILPKTLHTIQSYAFSYLPKLKYIVIPNSVINITSQPFVYMDESFVIFTEK